ncbi:dihydroxyacetone kinase phosphoryl donor subunit DhaM [Salimicrobium halophilum]|uniref:phosphoenolpyruvate--glycerone phosphotransferase n=1 Tax=Salimicrobium halophilum TaxID=86666 RepID=A0A1G8WLT0_9BACI|nr:dihydroxyacetone kinase phosphoryl donor subunit DhaM [Salimicrobium halophilum]SDJ79003.1 dihydroxyacetone kinase, phosphotransfer subunit [Salimicrobium halophilum]
MANVGIVLISHSPKVAEGVKDIISEAVSNVKVIPAGGTEEGGIGTSAPQIQQAIEEADSGGGVLLLYDIGSAGMNAEMAVELADKKDCYVADDIPLVEGGYVAAVEAGMERSLDEILTSLRSSFLSGSKE